MVLVTGAGAGIGAALARELARRGHGLLLVDRDGAALDAVAAGLDVDVATRVCDLTVKRQRTELVRAVHRSDRALVGVCNNAGIFGFGRFHELPYGREEEMVAVNAVAVHHLTGALLPGLVARGSGAILITASLAANQPMPGAATYAATKAFVHAFSEAIHTELRGTGVSCTSLQPNATRTEIAVNAGLAEQSDVLPAFLWASADDVARAGVEGMVRGRRTVVPGLHNRVITSPIGRFVPRTLGLPLMRGVAAPFLSRRGRELAAASANGSAAERARA